MIIANLIESSAFVVMACLTISALQIAANNASCMWLNITIMSILNDTLFTIYLVCMNGHSDSIKDIVVHLGMNAGMVCSVLLIGNIGYMCDLDPEIIASKTNISIALAFVVVVYLIRTARY